MQFEIIEKYLEGHGFSNNHVTQKALEALIVSEYYFTAGDGITGEAVQKSLPFVYEADLDDVTFCVLVLGNGTKVVGIGESQDEDGRKLAREDAIEQLWPMMGYALVERLNSTVH